MLLPSPLPSLQHKDEKLHLRGDAVRLFSNLVILLDERFIVQNAVHKPLIRLLKICISPLASSADPVGILPEDEADLIDLVCHLCSRIKTFPELLVLFFAEKSNAASPPFGPHVLTAQRRVPPLSLGQTLSSASTPAGDRDNLRPLSPTLSDASTQRTNSSAKRSLSAHGEFEFPLFNFLLKFLHREGHPGDFARAGLLFLIDVAMSSTDAVATSKHRLPTSSPSSSLPSNNGVDEVTLALAEYLLDSDFADVLGAGMGALYGLLPSKVVLGSALGTEEGMAGGMVLGGMYADQVTIPKTEEENRMRSLGLESTDSPDFKASLDLFLKLVEFTQDVLRRSPSSLAINSTPSPVMAPATALVASANASSILSSVKSIFLEAVLYPSILECSEADGSALAVLTYLEAIFNSIESESKLSDTILRFLMADDIDHQVSAFHLKSSSLSPFAHQSPPATHRKEKDVKRRKSQALVLIESTTNTDTRKANDYFTSFGRFSLKDFILQSLASQHQPTVLIALKLVNTLLTKHDRVTLSLLNIIPDPRATLFPPMKPEDVASNASSEQFCYPVAALDPPRESSALSPAID